MAHSKVWFVTGSSSGFGFAMVEAALSKGNKVVATLRKPEVLNDLRTKYLADQLLIVKLDVTKPEEIQAAFATAKAAFGRVDVVFNNAGWSIVGEIEGTPDKAVREMFEINFWGSANVSRTALKYFRENTPIGGHLLQVSSQAGVKAGPGIGYYSASKYALEGFSEALTKEIDPTWNIKITIIEPGIFRTKTVENVKILPIHAAYGNESLGSHSFRRFLEDPNMILDGDPNKAAEKFMEIVALEDPPLRFPIHRVAFETVRSKSKELTEVANNWESWSNDVYF